MCTKLGILSRNKSYIFLVLTFTFLYGVYTSLGAVVSYITKPYYEPSYNSLFAALFLVCGVVSSFIFGVILDKTKKYKRIIMVLVIGACIFVATSLYTLPRKSVPLFAVNISIIGVFVIPIIPISYALSVELTFPIDEAMSNGMMMLSS